MSNGKVSSKFGQCFQEIRARSFWPLGFIEKAITTIYQCDCYDCVSLYRFECRVAHPPSLIARHRLNG